MTPREAAIKYIRPYVERGDSLESLLDGHGGYGGGGVQVSIGDYFHLGNKSWNVGIPLTKLTRGQIAASVMVAGRNITGVYSVLELMTEILMGDAEPVVPKCRECGCEVISGVCQNHGCD